MPTKMNSIYGRKRNENENGHLFLAENENESHRIILEFFFFFIHLVTKSESQPYNYCLSQNAMVCLAHCRKNCNKSLEKLQDFFFKTETKTKTKCSRPRLHDPRPRPRPRLSFLSSRRLETKTLVSRTTSLG